ncbi:serine hydrolase domain-containing protein [Glacieibacterium sp.]|uniref:serine hydrolase domain-containing protein n=1 Tax=Glacieibacterium sp. TaxID=2860237 RepID=UPI003B008F14
MLGGLRAIILASLAALLFATPTLAQSFAPLKPRSMTIEAAVRPPVSDDMIAAFVDATVATGVETLGLPGAAVVVVRDGRTILSRGYGFADFATGRRISPENTLFRQASVSKLFTWLLVMQQVEAGKLSLDHDINDYLDFRIPDAFGRPITLRHLMTHTPGFDERVRGLFDQGPPTDLGKLLRENIPARVYAPGATMAYSNYGAALAAYIVERSARQPFEQLVQQRILTPLRMTHSTFSQPLPRVLAPLLAQGYLPGSRTPAPFEWVGTPSAGGMSASASDLGRFMAMLLGGGSLDGVQIIRPATLAAMLQIARPLAPGLPTGFGLGFEGGTEGGVRFMGHGGNLAAAATQLTLFPEQKLGIYVVFNGQGISGGAHAIEQSIVSSLVARLGGSNSRPIAIPADQSTASIVAGSYLSARRSHSGFLKLLDILSVADVTAADDGSITVSTITRSDGSKRRFVPVGHDRFADAETGAPLVFTRDAKGRVRGMAGEIAYPVAEFDRVGRWMSSAAPVMAFSLAIVVLTALTMPATAFLRWAWHVRRSTRPQREQRWFRRARLGAWAVSAAGVLWIVYLVKAEADVALLTNKAGPWLLLLGAVTVLGVFGAIALVVDAWSAWSDRVRGLWRKVWASVAGCAALVLLTSVFVFDLATFSASY